MAVDDLDSTLPLIVRPHMVLMGNHGTAQTNARYRRQDSSLSSMTEIVEADLTDYPPWGNGPGCSISIMGLLQANEVGVVASSERKCGEMYDDKGHTLSLSEISEASKLATIRSERPKLAKACGDEETKNLTDRFTSLSLPHIKNTNQNGFMKPASDERKRKGGQDPMQTRLEQSSQRPPPVKSKRTRLLTFSEQTDSSIFTVSDSKSLKKRIRPIDCSSLSIRRNGGVLHLSPRMQALQSFFDENRSVVEGWKSAALKGSRERSPTDLQWAEQKLRTFSANNKMNPAAPAKGKYFDQSSHLGDSVRPTNTYIPYSGLFTRESEKMILSKQPKDNRTERRGSTFDPLIISDKITPEAQEILLVLRDTVATVIDDIITIDQEIPRRNFAPCVAIVDHLQMLPNMLIALIDHLHYTPQEFELVSVAKNITELIEDVSDDPVIVLFRMIELGHYLYYLGRILGEKIVPKDLPRLLHSIQVKLQRMKVGHVVRQYFHIPISFDFVITPYNKDRQLVRLEEECHCIVNLLHPDDPRSQYCPPSYRTIEVVYDDEAGRFETFLHRLNRILSPRRCTARLVTTILRQFNGHEIAMTAEHAADLLNSDHRPRYEDIRALVVSGSRSRSEKLLPNV